MPPTKKTRLADRKIEDVVRRVCGDDAIPLVKKLRGNENVSEFKLADQLKEDIKRVRNLLYRLYGHNLVGFTRKKDKKKGWYIYYWTFNTDRVRFLYERLRGEELARLRERLAEEKNGQFFSCPAKCVRLGFDQATDFEYRCPECGEIVVQEVGGQRTGELVKRISELERK